MGLSRIQIQKKPERQFPANTNLCMGHSLANTLGIYNRSIVVNFGTSMGIAHLRLTPQKNSMIQLSEQLTNQLLLPCHASMYARFDHRSFRLRLGPLLGILIDTYPKDHHTNPFGQMTKFLEECAQSGKNHGIQVAIFLPQTLSTSKKQMQGWVHHQDKWVKTTLPLPDVIYNRITSRKVESQKELQAKLSILRTYYKIPIFNETFLNKLQVHRLLTKVGNITHMIPTTYPFRKQLLKRMIERYPVLYLKPTNGSLGKGIIRLVKKPDQIYYQSTTTGGTVTLKFRSIAECVKVVAGRINRQSYLIQRGLHLATYAGRQLDFRVLAQKNRSGTWSITSTVARIVSDKNIVSNLARGGTIRKASDVLRELRLQRKPTLAELKATALMVIQTFEQQADGHFAELGIDLALDKKGKIWLIEINSKPSKTDDSVINPNLSIRPSVTRLMNYIYYLTDIHPSHSHKKRKQRKGAKR